MPLFLIALIVFLVGSLFAFVLYGIDKRRAKRGAWRISEKALLLTGLLIGAPGALAAMQLLRHKTKHYYFYAVNILGLVLQVGAVVLLFLKA